MMVVDKPKMSVVIPVYNRANLVLQAVDSVLGQTFINFELIIVDDGSTEPLSLPNADERIRVIRLAVNRGAAAARNSGFRAARGEYIALLDSDDAWLPEKLAQQVDLLENNSSAQACVTGYYLHKQGEVDRKVLPPRPRSWLKHLLIGSALGAGSTLVFRRRCLEEIGYLDESLPRYEEWDWLIEFVKMYPLFTLNRPLARVQKAGRPRALVIEESALRFVAKHDADFRHFGFYGQRARAKRWLEVAECYFAEGNHAKGRYYLWRTLRQNPFQLPTMYLSILDSLLGTSFRTWLVNLYYSARKYVRP